MFHKFEEVPYQVWGPWKNSWGYVTTIAEFSNEDIVLKSITPYKTKIVKYFTDWEDCEREVQLLEQDRRF